MQLRNLEIKQGEKQEYLEPVTNAQPGFLGQDALGLPRMLWLGCPAPGAV